ncbi:MAG: MBL fold metallo-hydrolase [Acidobacteria bacterium]|nr:MBL fold metallo-hydrolase [Acidobacteriota bacterium]
MRKISQWAAVLVLVLGTFDTLPYVASGFSRTILAQQRPYEEVPFETIQIRPNVYAIFGAGANVTAHVGEDGIVVVDSGTAPMAEKVLDAVRRLSTRPIRYIINTSADVDHVGGNAVLGRAGRSIMEDTFTDEERAAIVAHENVLLRLSTPPGGAPPLDSDAWPSETFTSRFRSIYVNDDAVQIIRQLGAHSDGDVLVHFRRADVIVTGDILDLRHFPVIDAARGGSIQGELDALNRLLDLTVPAMPNVLKPGRTLLVPGHGRIADYAELVEYRDMLTIVRDIVADMVKKGMTLDEVKKANPTAGYRARWGRESGPWTTDMFVEAVYNGLKSGQPKS